MLSPIDFLFNFDNFPLNGQLVTTTGENAAGSRRSPSVWKSRTGAVRHRRRMAEQRLRPL